MFKNGTYARVISTQSEHSPPGQQIQVAMSIAIKEPFTLTTDITFVEANGTQHLDEGRIEMSLMQFVLATLLCV